MEYNYVTAMCPAGLGNRIKCIISCMKDLSYTNVDVYWPINKECGCEFKELFKESTPITEVDSINKNSKANKSWKFTLNSGEEIDFKYNKLSKAKVNEFLPYVNLIKPAQDITDAAWAFENKYKESFDKSEVIGVHIRRGDFLGLYDRRSIVSTEERFIERIRCLLDVNPNYMFLLCTEDSETECKFKDLFGKHIIIFPKRFRGREGKEGVKEAFVDMLLLSKCPIIIGTFLSTFTELAWWLGGCKAKVLIPGAECKEVVDKVLAKLPKHGESIFKKVSRRIKIWMKEGV